VAGRRNRRERSRTYSPGPINLIRRAKDRQNDQGRPPCASTENRLRDLESDPCESFSPYVAASCTMRSQRSGLFHDAAQRGNFFEHSRHYPVSRDHESSINSVAWFCRPLESFKMRGREFVVWRVRAHFEARTLELLARLHLEGEAGTADRVEAATFMRGRCRLRLPATPPTELYWS